MKDDEKKHLSPDKKDLDVHVKVGWVKGLNRLYFLYEAYDNFWDFADPGLHNDTFEIVVDGDRSGGPLVPKFRAPENIKILVAGGTAGRFSAIVPGWTFSKGSALVFRQIRPASLEDTP